MFFIKLTVSTSENKIGAKLHKDHHSDTVISQVATILQNWMNITPISIVEGDDVANLTKLKKVTKNCIDYFCLAQTMLLRLELSNPVRLDLEIDGKTRYSLANFPLDVKLEDLLKEESMLWVFIHKL